MSALLLRRVISVPERLPAQGRHPFDLPFVHRLDLQFVTPVTFFVGENGTGKSTLLEAIAALARFPVSGGGANEVGSDFAPEHESELAYVLRPSFSRVPRDGYFLRAEFLAHFATLLDDREKDPHFGGDPYARYGGKSLHQQSHGEAFLSVLNHRTASGLYLFDEPESALSPQRQLALLLKIDRLVQRKNCQFVIATHSPILLTYPGATIISFDSPALRAIEAEETSHFRLTRGILENPGSYWNQLRKENRGPEPQ